MFTFIDVSGTSVSINNAYIWVAVAIAFAIALALYALRSIGVYVMARRKQVKNAWISFLPLVWFYVVCKLIGDAKIFKTTVGKLAVIFCIVFAVSSFLTFAYEFLSYFPLVGNFLAGREIYFASEVVPIGLVEYWVGNSGIYVNPNTFVYPYGNGGAYPNHMITFMNVISYVSNVFDIANVVITILVYINLFKAYWPQNFMVGLVLSILGFFPIVIFVLRKKEPVDYREFMRARYNNYYYGSQNNPNNYNEERKEEPKTPFEEFAEKGEQDPGNPFSEFDGQENTDDKE